MLVKIIDEHHPQGVIVAWDAGWSGREKTYDLYKAQRKPRPDLLREQWPHLIPLVEAFGYTNVKVEGFEADDVIASLAKQARAEGIDVMVVTGDRDAYQLVGDGIRVMSTSRGITETKIYDVAAVEERYGVPPTLITDLMGLRGDTSDNIPGVPGIGEKTATQLLQKFGSLDKVLESVDEISGAKRKENLTNHADDARMSRELATLQYDIETGVDLAGALESASPTAPRCGTSCASSSSAPCSIASKRRCPRATRSPAARSRPSSRSRRWRGPRPTSATRRGSRWRSRATAGPPPKASASSPARTPTTSSPSRSPTSRSPATT